MTRALVLLALPLMVGCKSALIKVETSAPNAVAYLVKGEPDTAGVPSRFEEKAGLPASMSVPAGKYWLYVDAPHHAARVVRLDKLSKKKENLIRVELEATKQQEYLK